MKLIKGTEYAKTIKEEVAEATKLIKELKGDTVSLVIIQVGNNPASDTYVRNKIKACEDMGIEATLTKFPEEIKESVLLMEIEKLNSNPNVHGIIVQLPLPKHINEMNVACHIDFRKDIDGLNPANIGFLDTGMLSLVPCTAIGIVETLAKIYAEKNDSIEGKHCVVVGRSNIVGKPVAKLMLMENATVTVCHSKTKNLEDITRTADILIVAVGIPNFIQRKHVRNGVVIIDVGINKDENGKLCGDVDFNNVKDKALMITPVPGGVGPLTTAMVGKNTVRAYNLQNPEEEIKPEISIRVNKPEDKKEEE